MIMQGLRLNYYLVLVLFELNLIYKMSPHGPSVIIKFFVFRYVHFIEWIMHVIFTLFF